MLLRRVFIGPVVLGLVLGCAAVGGNDDSSSAYEAEAIAALRATLAKVGTHDGDGFRAGFTTQGLEDFARHEWGVPSSVVSATGDLDDAVEHSVYVVDSLRVTDGSTSRVAVAVQEGTRDDLSQDRFVLTRVRERWLIDVYDPRTVSPAVPAGYQRSDIAVREYEITSAAGLPPLPASTAFTIRNDGDFEHDIMLLWLSARVPTEGFFFGVAEAWPPLMEPYGGIRVAPGGDCAADSSAAAGTSRRAVRAVLHTWRAGTVACAARDAARAASAVGAGRRAHTVFMEPISAGTMR